MWFQILDKTKQNLQFEEKSENTVNKPDFLWSLTL